MLKSQVDSTALAVIALAALLALTLLAGPFAWMASIVGLVLLLILFSFDQEGYRSVAGSLAFSAVCGICFAVACGALFSLMAAHGEVHLADGGWQSVGLPFAFVFATLVIWAVDRSRMSARVPASERIQSHPGGIQGSFIRPAAPPTEFSNLEPQRMYPQPTVAPPSPVYAPQPVAAQPAYSAPQPVAAPPQIVAQPVVSQPVFSQPMFSPQPVLPPEPVAPPQPLPAETVPAMPPPQTQTTLMPPPSEAALPAVAPVIPRGGKEVMIYVTLLGEGLNVMRSVRAEHLGRDFYHIIDNMPPEETWQFQPGQVVRCKKQNLSTGKALVAVEEAPRAQ